MKQKILIIMVEVGSGHKSPAIAIQSAIERLYPNRFTVEVIDFARMCGALHDDAVIKGFWNHALKHAKTTNILNRLMDTFRWLTRCNFATQLFYREFLKKGTAYLRDYQPDIVISTHFLASSVAGLARKKHGLSWPLISCMSDPFNGHNLWVNPLVDTLLVATEEAKKHILSLGANPANTVVMPYPLHERFFPKDGMSTDTKKNKLVSFGLNPAQKTVLVSSGGQGIGNAVDYLRLLVEEKMPLNILAVCGKNTDLYRELNLLQARIHMNDQREIPTRMQVFGYVQNMPELLELADFSVSKAGANATLEMLVKKVPPIFTQCAALIEKGNIDWCVARGFGWWQDTPDGFLTLVRQLIETDLLATARSRMDKDLYIRSLPNASDLIAHEVVRCLISSSTGRKTKTVFAH